VYTYKEKKKQLKIVALVNAYIPTYTVDATSLVVVVSMGDGT
jgi:hypothetical protein